MISSFSGTAESGLAFICCRYERHKPVSTFFGVSRSVCRTLLYCSTSSTSRSGSVLFDVALENAPVADLGSIDHWRYEGIAGVGTDSELPRKRG